MVTFLAPFEENLPLTDGLPWLTKNAGNIVIKYSWFTHDEIFRVTGHLWGNSLVTGEFPAQRPVTRSFDVLFDLRLNKRLSKQWWCWWFETPSRPLWRRSICGNIESQYVDSQLYSTGPLFSIPTDLRTCSQWDLMSLPSNGSPHREPDRVVMCACTLY